MRQRSLGWGAFSNAAISPATVIVVLQRSAEHFVVDVEIVVGEATPQVGEEAVIGVLGGIFRHRDAEGGPTSMLLKMKYTP
jgi:hypothetical protein